LGKKIAKPRYFPGAFSFYAPLTTGLLVTSFVLLRNGYQLVTPFGHDLSRVGHLIENPLPTSPGNIERKKIQKAIREKV
jgi:hypothetical protein